VWEVPWRQGRHQGRRRWKRREAGLDQLKQEGSK
jgi:hypothetical protein